MKALQKSLLMATAMCVAALPITHSAHASELTYRPTNPAFGGNPLNTTHLQYQAASNNQHQDDNAPSTQDAIADLVRRSAASQIAQEINTQIFDGTDLDGSFLLGDGSSISYERAGGIISITFFNPDGTTSTFEVPD